MYISNVFDGADIACLYVAVAVVRDGCIGVVIGYVVDDIIDYGCGVAAWI